MSISKFFFACRTGDIFSRFSDGRDQNLPFRKFQLEKRLPKILGDLFRVKIRKKWAMLAIFRCSKILGEAGKQEILRQMFRKF